MSAQEPQFLIPGLREIEVLELEEELPDGLVSSRPPAESSNVSEHGDFGLTAAIVIISVAAINGLAIWLAKRRDRSTDTTDITIKKVEALRRRHHVRMVNESMLAWLLVTANNTIRNHGRQQRRYRHFLQQLPRPHPSRTSPTKSLMLTSATWKRPACKRLSLSSSPWIAMS